MSITSMTSPNNGHETDRVDIIKIVDPEKLKKRLEVAKTVCKVALYAIAIVSVATLLAGVITLIFSSPLAPILLTIGFASPVLRVPLVTANHKIEGKLDGISWTSQEDKDKLQHFEKELGKILKNWKNLSS